MPLFVVHEHRARNLHWDLRLEIGGVMKSWAVPKEPPLAPGIRRLAIEVEDHPLSYASFEGTIPEGSYGAGTVKIWDSGDFVLLENVTGKIVVELKGRKISGTYCLIKTGRGWLFFRKKQSKP